MASVIDMSLDDIIQKKKRENKRSGNAPKARIKKNASVTNRVPPPDVRSKKFPIIDARNKIISKKRTQITDARDKLAELAKQKDARQKLEQLRKKKQASASQGRLLVPHGRALGSQQARALSSYQGRALAQHPGREIASQQGKNLLQSHGKIIRATQNKERVFIDHSRHVVSQPLSRKSLTAKHQLNTKKFLENRSIERKTSSNRQYETPRLKPILRTVENDLDIIEDDDDPMGEDYNVAPMASLNRKANLQLRIVAHNNDVREAKSSSTRTHRLLTPEKEISPPRPPSILKKRPMAALRNEKKTEKPSLEYRIIVSNLKNTVTGGDIEELFGDVGGMVESRLVRPGTAEVIYKSAGDAQKAVELYHNRQLDGQPMNCLLVAPRSATPAATRGNSKPALYSTNSNVEPDISTFHKVLFSNF